MKCVIDSSYQFFVDESMKCVIDSSYQFFLALGGSAEHFVIPGLVTCMRRRLRRQVVERCWRHVGHLGEFRKRIQSPLALKTWARNNVVWIDEVHDQQERVGRGRAVFQPLDSLTEPCVRTRALCGTR